MSGLTVPTTGRFVQYFDPVTNFNNNRQEDLTSASQVKKTHDPFGLRQRYASSRQDVIDTLDKIDAALADFNPEEDRYLNLNGIDFTPLNDLIVNRNHEILTLEGLLRASQNISQYPLYRANLRGAILAKVDLQEANLAKADLREVDLTNAYLRGAYLRGADLRGAFAIFGSERLTGDALKDYLLECFKVHIDETTTF